MLLDWADFMTVRRIDDKSLDSSVSPNTQPSVKPPNQFITVQSFAHSNFGEILDATGDIIVQKPYENGFIIF